MNRYRTTFVRTKLWLCFCLACSCGGGPGIPALNTLQGDEAFPLKALGARYGSLADGGLDPSSVTIDAADTLLPNLCPSTSVVTTKPIHELTVRIQVPAGETVSAGTYPVGLEPVIEPPFAEIVLSLFENDGGGVSSQQTTYVAGGGSITCTAINDQHTACSFSADVEAVNTAFPPRHSLTGNFDAPSSCSDAGVSGD